MSFIPALLSLPESYDYTDVTVPLSCIIVNNVIQIKWHNIRHNTIPMYQNVLPPIPLSLACPKCYFKELGLYGSPA